MKKINWHEDKKIYSVLAILFTLIGVGFIILCAVETNRYIDNLFRF